MALARLILTLLGALVTLSACTDTPAGPATERVTIGGRTFTLELALTSDARAQGLMHRTSLPEEGGMLFIFPRPDMQSFWMAYTLIDLDIIYLDGLGFITAMHEMKAEPPKRPDESESDYFRRMRQSDYNSVLPAQFAIELKGGTLRSLSLEPGQKVDLDLPRLKALAQ
jgi:uncharacterized protein